MTIIAFFLLFFQVETSPGDQWAVYLERANADAENCVEFLEVMTLHKDDDPTSQGYFALATMLQAKLHGNPFTKLSFFNKGKKILEETIQENPGNIELRFLRFAVQTEVPGILLYFNEIEADRAMLDEHLLHAKDGLAERIKKFYELKGIDVKS